MSGKPVIYDTPGRECYHADKGCCARCLDPVHYNPKQAVRVAPKGKPAPPRVIG